MQRDSKIREQKRRQRQIYPLQKGEIIETRKGRKSKKRRRRRRRRKS